MTAWVEGGGLPTGSSGVKCLCAGRIGDRGHREIAYRNLEEGAFWKRRPLLKCPFPRGSTELEIPEIQQIQHIAENKREFDRLVETLENLELLEILEVAPTKRPLL